LSIKKWEILQVSPNVRVNYKYLLEQAAKEKKKKSRKK